MRRHDQTHNNERFKAAVAGARLFNWQSYYGTNNIDTWMISYFGASLYDDPKRCTNAACPYFHQERAHTDPARGR